MRSRTGTSSTAAGVVAALILAAGCGPQAPAGEADDHPNQPTSRGACTQDALDAGHGQRIAGLGGGGDPVALWLVRPGAGPCAGGLVARTSHGVEGVDVSDLDLVPATASVVRLEATSPGGTTELLLVHGGRHPRGGFQPHLFALTGGLHEVRVDGDPLLPFVATDGGGTPTTARCGDHGRIEVLTATTSEPPGVILAWDVQRTTYRLVEGEAQQQDSEQIRDHAADPVLRKKMPQLFEPDGFFADCTA